MWSRPRITVIIPVLNERDALPRVLGHLPWCMLSEVVVVDSSLLWLPLIIL